MFRKPLWNPQNVPFVVGQKIGGCDIVQTNANTFRFRQDCPPPLHLSTSFVIYLGTVLEGVGKRKVKGEGVENETRG